MGNSNRKLRIVVLGMMGRCPFGGQAWLYLNWLLGLAALGHEVWYVEDDNVWPYDPVANTVTDDCSHATRHIARCMDQIGLANRWAFRLADRKDACWGLSPEKLNELYGSCDVLLNIVGATDLREEHMKAPLRVYVETDPVVAELQLANGDEHTRAAFAAHDQVVTYGENYGAADCRVPLNGTAYKKTRQPIALEFWPMTYNREARFFTTIGNYRQQGNDIDYNGETYYWSKHHEWEKFMDLPRHTSQEFELAMMPENMADREKLQRAGWILVSPLEMSLDVFGAYQDYFRRSRGEFTVAKDIYVRPNSGWFSDRAVCYLASGRPVVTMRTGFTSYCPVGDGLFDYASHDEALAAIDALAADYGRHCRAARDIAGDCFDAARVLAELTEAIGL